MKNAGDPFPGEKQKAVLELTRGRKEKCMPTEVWGIKLSIIDALELSESTKESYRYELEKLFNSGINIFDFDALLNYTTGLNPTHRLQLMRALRHMCSEYERSEKEKATPENFAVVQALVMRLEAIRDTVKVQTDTGSPNRIWLSPSQVRYLSILGC